MSDAWQLLEACEQLACCGSDGRIEYIYFGIPVARFGQ